MKLLGINTGIEGYNDANRVLEACSVVETKKFGTFQSKPAASTVNNDNPEKTHILDLNLEPLKPTKVMHLLDLHDNFEGNLNMDAITALMKDNAYMNLPEPLKPTEEVHVGYSIQLNVHKNPAGNKTILKWYISTTLNLPTGSRTSCVQASPFNHI